MLRCLYFLFSIEVIHVYLHLTKNIELTNIRTFALDCLVWFNPL